MLNTARGAVINFADLKRYGDLLNWCLDVWENEPKIDFEMLGASLIATPISQVTLFKANVWEPK